MTTATITIMRDDVDYAVDVWGAIKYYGSANPHERGPKAQLDGYTVYDSDGKKVDIKLTLDEEDDAIWALERNI